MVLIYYLIIKLYIIVKEKVINYRYYQKKYILNLIIFKNKDF